MQKINSSFIKKTAIYSESIFILMLVYTVITLKRFLTI